MTMQRTDIIIINAIEYSLGGLPLQQYWDLGNPKPSLCSMNTGMSQREYYANWLIEDHRLYLTEFHGSHFFKKIEYSLDYIFPENAGKVFASWFTGELSISYGRELRPFYIDFIKYEHTTSIHIENGVVISNILIGDIVSIQVNNLT